MNAPKDVHTRRVQVEKAHAKINLGLKVVGRRPDGFHEIRTIMQTVDLADVVYLYPAVENSFSCTDPTLPAGKDNLASRAAVVFDRWRCLNWPDPAEALAFRIHLEKHIPVGAGLGGGSADAAAVLRSLNRVYGEGFDGLALQKMAAQLGSDVPFLIWGGTALVRGRGEVVEPFEWVGEFHYVLVYPAVQVSTAWAYRQLGPVLTGPSSYLKFINSLSGSGGRVYGRDLLSVLENDFQPLVERVNPIVAELSSWLRQAGAQACSMSGSGSTVFGIFDDRNAAHQAQKGLQARGFRSFLCRPTSPQSTPVTRSG